MNEKEMNLAILKELRKIAGKVFAKVTVSKEGTYTAAELWDEKDAFGESIVIDYKGTESEIYTAEIETFKMQVTPQKLWYVLWKFEKLCNVKQANKIRFTYGNAENEIISEKAMYKSNSGKIITRKKTMVKVEENVAYSVEKSNVNIFVLYFLANGIWYAVGEAANKESVKSRAKLLMQKDFILNNLTRRPELMDETITTVAPIFKALYKVLTTKACNDTKEEGKSENEPENTVICEVAKVDTSAREFNKHEALKETEKRMREKHPNYIALIRYNGMYYSYEKSAKEIRFKARDFVRRTNHHIYEENSLERKRNGNTSVYRILIRGETEICNW